MIRIVEARGCEGRSLVSRLVARCDAASVRARLFFPEGRRLGPDVVGLLAGRADGVAYLAMDERRPVGLANMVPNPDGSVEAALLVARHWQRRGIGRRLTVHALADPRWAGRAVRATVAPGNRAITRLLRSVARDVRLLSVGPGECYLEVRAAQEPLRTAG